MNSMSDENLLYPIIDPPSEVKKNQTKDIWNFAIGSNLHPKKKT